MSLSPVSPSPLMSSGDGALLLLHAVMDVDVSSPEDVLLRSPWLPISLGGCRLLAKSWFGETAYRVLLTDLHCVWEERMDAADVQSRAQELNRRLRASAEAFFSHLREAARPCLSGGGGEAQVSLTRRDDGRLAVRLKSELGGLPFHWEFRLSPAPVATACEQLVRPLLAMSRLLQQQLEQLGGMLARKDAEIQDYRENGASLTRERLKTDVFLEKTYREDFMAKALPGLQPERCDALGFDAPLQQLYAAVVAPRKRRREEEQRVAEPDDTAATDDRSESEPADQDGDPTPNGPETRDGPATQQVPESRLTCC
ncbi:non-homologous end-joining factor 1 [Cololabis saira]|uniref:non-homologous end-joining factor 1 n=1 Tax=Cololabis saira TaxID=129043 RepID=UPI002AD37448|nr:non-homologous end-joining factor 1 [Cololabis saira]